MPWINHKFLFKPDGTHDWSQSHAQVPSALVLDDVVRVYYATRDAQGRSLTSFIDIDKNDLTRIVYVHDRPVMNLGKPGTHDEDGVMVGCVVKNEAGEIFLYYTGWSKQETVPYRVTVGLAKSNDNGVTFERVFEGPIVDRTAHEPYMTMSPYVAQRGGGWHMWYGSGIGWVEIDGKMEPLYQVKYPSSIDGYCWRQDNLICIEQAHTLEANTRPSVLEKDGQYEMWFSYRHSVDFRGASGGYRIGYATSPDGRNWQRRNDPEGLGPTPDGWMKNMVAYPNVIVLNNQRIMFYNGDGFGRSGFGFAVWEE